MIEIILFLILAIYIVFILQLIFGFNKVKSFAIVYFRMISILFRKWNHYRERVEKSISLFWLSVNPELKQLGYFKKMSNDKIF